MLPTFLIIGAMKAGTTALYEYLREHPQVFMSGEKEVHFFATEENWRRGLGWYEAHFEGAGDAVAIGEAAPSYAFRPMIPNPAARIARAIPAARLVYLVRHPLQRIRSMYLHSFTSGWESRSIEQALLEDHMYLESSRYAFQLEPYLEHFPEEQILVVPSEDLRDRREETMVRVLAFVGADPRLLPPNLSREVHRGEEKLAPTAAGGLLQRVPGWAAVERMLPPGLRSRARRAIARPIDAAAMTIPAHVAERYREALRPDVAALRRHLPPEWDGWGIA